MQWYVLSYAMSTYCSNNVYVTGFAKRGLIRAIVNTEKSRFEILITVYL